MKTLFIFISWKTCWNNSLVKNFLHHFSILMFPACDVRSGICIVLWPCLSHTWTSRTLLNIRFLVAGYPHSLPRIFIYMYRTCTLLLFHFAPAIPLFFSLRSVFPLLHYSCLSFTFHVFLLCVWLTRNSGLTVPPNVCTHKHKHTHTVIGGHLKSLPHPFVAIFSSCTVTEHG